MSENKWSKLNNEELLQKKQDMTITVIVVTICFIIGVILTIALLVLSGEFAGVGILPLLVLALTIINWNNYISIKKEVKSRNL